MPEVMNVFTGDAYSKVSLTEQMNRIPAKPGRIGEMGLFQREGIATPTLAIEEEDGKFNIIKTSARGDEGNRRRTDKKRVRYFEVPHLEEYSDIFADDIIGTRMFGEMPGQTSETAKGDIVAKRMAKMVADHEVTCEYHKLGAIKGVVLDADGSTLYDWFSEYNVTKKTLNYDGGTTVKLSQYCRDLKRHMATVLGNLSNGGKPVIHQFVGSDFMDAIADDSTVKDDYQRWMDGKRNYADNAANDVFEYQGVLFEEYYGYFDGSTPFIAANKGHAFPLGTELFKTRDAPADWWDAVGTVGLPYYAEITEMKKKARIDSQSNPISLCTLPGVLVEATVS